MVGPVPIGEAAVKADIFQFRDRRFRDTFAGFPFALRLFATAI
jgi:hypothetical protein